MEIKEQAIFVAAMCSACNGYANCFRGFYVMTCTPWQPCPFHQKGCLQVEMYCKSGYLF